MRPVLTGRAASSKGLDELAEGAAPPRRPQAVTNIRMGPWKVLSPPWRSTRMWRMCSAPVPPPRSATRCWRGHRLAAAASSASLTPPRPAGWRRIGGCPGVAPTAVGVLIGIQQASLFYGRRVPRGGMAGRQSPPPC